MTSERTSGSVSLECGSRPLDIDDVHILLQVEQEQIQKRTFTNWINAQLAKRRPPVSVLDLFNDLRDGSRLLDLMEVMSGHRMSREKGRGTFQHRTNIEKALAFLKRKSIKLVNINVSDIMDGKPSIILGLVWTIIMHFHIEELASTLSFSSRQSSLESLASLDSRSTSSSARSSPVPPRSSPLHARFRVSAKKALLLWVREQCHRAGCTLNVKDFKGSWRSGVVFLAILHALRPNSVDLSRARTRTNRQNLEEAFHIAERELHIPRLLDPADVDVWDPDEKSIMTYVAQFLQYSKDTPASDEEMQHLTSPQRLSPVRLPSDFTPAVAASSVRQAHLLLPCPIKSAPSSSPEPARAAAPGTSANQKAQEVTCWLKQAYQELTEGWDSTEGESYAERYHVFHTFIVSFNEQRRPVMPLLTRMKRASHLSVEQKTLRHAWDTLTEKLRECKTELDLSLPSPLEAVGRWLLRVEELLSAGESDTLEHARAAEEAHEKHELLKVCLEEMPHHIKRFNTFQNTDEFGETLVPSDKMEEMKRRFTSVRVAAKYHSIKLEYHERRHTVLDLLNQLNVKLRSWRRAYISQESVRALMQDWNETVNKQEMTSLLDGAFHRLKQIAGKYTSKSALAEDSSQVIQQVAGLEADVAATLKGVRIVRGTMGRVLTAWDSYCDMYTSLLAWLQQGPPAQRHGQRTEVTSSMMSEWSSLQAHLNEVGNYLIEVTDPQTSRTISDELCKINLLWAAKTAQFALAEEPSIGSSSPQTVQALIREANQLLKEPVEVVSTPLRTYTKRLQLMMKKIKDVDLEALSPSLDCSRDTLSKLQQAIPEVLQTLCEAEQVCDELRLSVTGLDGRLAELLLWETEVRELYQLLKEEAHRQTREQDPRVRLLISRGLQLEGQVVMEEQDLQIMVMTSQKNSPLQYLIASTMQDRVRAVVEKSQEAVGMLSSLGACRERSPARDQPPTKIFVKPQETQEEPQSKKPPMVSSFQHSSEAPGQTDSQPTVKVKVPVPSQIPFDVPSQAVILKAQPSSEPAPMIVVQEYEEEERSPQPEIQPNEQEKNSHIQVTKVRSNEVQSEERIEILTKHHIESQQSLPQPVTQQQEVIQVVSPEVQVKTSAKLLPQGQTVTLPQKEGRGQHQAPHQKHVRARKSQEHLQNRPWLQQRGPLESVTHKRAQSEPVSKSQKSVQVPLQRVATSSHEAQRSAQSMTHLKSKSTLHTKAKQQKQPQPVAQQQPLVKTQSLPQAVPATPEPPVTQKQPQQPVALTQQHQASISTQAQTTTQNTQSTTPIKQQVKPQLQSITTKHSQVLIPKHQSVTPVQPQQTVAQSPSVPQPQRSGPNHKVSQARPQGSSRPVVQRHSTSPIQAQIKKLQQQSPQIVVQTQSQQPSQHSQSPQPKRASPIQPRIISVPQPQTPVPSQTHKQVKAQGSAELMVQPQVQSQCGLSKPGNVTQSYPQVQGPSSVTAQMQPMAYFQTHPQPQSVHPAQPQQSLSHPYGQIRPQGSVEHVGQSVSQPAGPCSPQQPQQNQQQSQTTQSQVTQAQLQSQVSTKLSIQEHSQQQSTPVKQPALAQAPPQAYTEAYRKAQALVRNRFEEAKYCLQEHILEAISVLRDKQMTDEQASVTEETLRALDPELLEEFLRAAEGMESFCTPSELRDMEFFTQSVRTQWEAVEAQMSEHLRQLKFEITRLRFNRMVETCEMHVRRETLNHTPESMPESKEEACFSAEGSLAQAGQQLEALRELCDTLSPEDAYRLAQAQLRECERRLAAIQRQFSGDPDMPPPEPRLQMEQAEEPRAQKEPVVPSPPEKPTEAATAFSPPCMRTVEKRETVKQTGSEEDRYRSCRFALLAQLNRNEQCMLGDRPSESVTPADLRKRLRELKSLWDETELLWKEYETLCMQCVQFKERTVEQDRMELTGRWREQRAQLQRRVESLKAALELMDSIELKISEISERLQNFIKERKDIKGYTLDNPAILRDVKDLDESIQIELDRLSRFDSEPSHLDLRDRSPLTQVVLNHRSSLDRLRQQVRKSDAAARALDRFLMSLRTVELDVSSVQSAPSSDSAVLQDSRCKLALIRKGVSSLNDKAPQLDLLLGGAQLEVTQDGSPVSCLDMVGVLVRRVEDVDDRLMVRQKDLQTEQQSQGHGLRRKTMLAELRKVQGAAEKQGLKDPTMPAVQHRIRALSDLESQLNSLCPEYQSIRTALSKLSSQREQPDPAEEELKSLWDETERAVSDRQEQCTVLMELLKKFQNCRSYLGNTLQRAEQTNNEQASYMGKENLQRLLAKVIGIKEELSGLGSKIEEFRAVCKQLQSQLKKIPDCSETPFEAEADSLVDSWLDASEKTDSYLDNLHVGLELWEKLLVLGGEVDSWTSTKLIIFSESHPFTSESEVLSVKNEIQSQEDNLEHFHGKLSEIQELLQSKESPLELQVMETNLRKKLEQVKELFSDCTDVFQELLTVKAHLTQKIDTSRSSVENIRTSVEMVHSEDTQMDAQLQDLCEQLLDQEKKADSLLKEIHLMSSIAESQATEDLTNHSRCLKKIIAETKELIRQKKGHEKKSFLQTVKEKFNSFEEWLQDEQLSVNECFENPERRQDVEASVQRLMSFLESKEGEERLARLKEMFEGDGLEKIPSEAQALFSTWLQEQEGELATLRAHCHGRHKQLDNILLNLNNMQEEHDHLRDWLQQREEVPVHLLSREQLRHVQEKLLQESGRVEAFRDLLSTVRMRGLRGDPLLKDSEALIEQYHSTGVLLENQAEVHKALDHQAETFQTNAERTRAWIRDVKHGLEALETDAPMQKNLTKALAVLNLRPEGATKLEGLKEEVEVLCAHEILEETRRQEFIYTLKNAEDEWKKVLDIAQQIKKQAELQDTLSRELQDFQAQEESIQSWVRGQLQMLHSVEKNVQAQEQLSAVQAVLALQHEAGSRLASLKRQGQILCSYKELDNERRSHVDQTQIAVEEEWRKVVQLAQELENQVKHEDSLCRELQIFCDEEEDTCSWIRQLRKNLDSLDVEPSVQEKLHTIEAVLAHTSEGDCKLADLKRKGESLCSCEDLEENRRLTIQQTLQGVQEEWTGVMMYARELKNQLEREDFLSKDLQDFQEQVENTQSWMREQQLKIELLGEDTLVQDRITGAQTILNSEPDGDSKIASLWRKAEGLCSWTWLEEMSKQEIQQNLRSIDEEWKMIMAGAQELKNQAELQDSLSRELQDFHTQERTTCSWVKNQKNDLESLGKNTYGTQGQIKERLNKAHAIVTLRSEGNSKIEDLRRTLDDLCICEDTKHALVDQIGRLEAEWKEVLQQAQELQSLLKSVLERLESCHCQREQLQSHLQQVKQQITALPRLFPWPGLGDRRHTVEQAKSLLDRTRSLTSSLSALRALGREMSQLTRDSSWIDPSWATMEECIPELIKELSEFCVNLEEEIRKERVCAQLVEQHNVAQDWLRDQVKGFCAPPTEHRALQSSFNTLKALLQTAEREKKEMRELDAVKDSLVNLCTPEGRDALTSEVSHLHDLCVSSEQELRERLAACEARLANIDLRLAEKAQILRAQAEGLLDELRAQDHSLGFLEDSQNISHLQENWQNFKICEKELESLEGKVRDLGQALVMAPPNEETPGDVISLVDTVTQQYCSLRSKLSEKQNDCADGTVRFVRQALENIQSWNQMNHADPHFSSATSIQAAIEEGAKLHKNLQVALSHKQLLGDCLGPDLAGKLERDGTKALNETDSLLNDLTQEFEDLEEKDVAERLAQSIQLDSQVNTVTMSTTTVVNTIPKVELEQSEIISSSSIISESCIQTDDDGQAEVQPELQSEVQPELQPELQPEVQPSETPNREIPVCVISETTTQIETCVTRQSLPVLQSDTQQSDLKTNATEMIPEPDTRVCETPVLTSSSGANESENELHYISVDLEAKVENDETTNEKMQTPSSEDLRSLEATVKDTEIDLDSNEFLSTEKQESRLSIVVVSSDLFPEKTESEDIEVVCAEKYEEEEDSYIPDSQEQCGREGDIQAKKVAALVLDVDTVHIQSVDIPTDRAVESIVSASSTENESTQCPTLSKQDGVTLAPPKVDDSEVAIEAKNIQSSPNEPGMVSRPERSSALDQSQFTKMDINKQVEVTPAPPTTTHSAGDAAGRDVGMLTWNNGPTVARADREVNWTTDNGPCELQRRYIVLDFPEGVEIQRRPASASRETSEVAVEGSESEGRLMSAEDETAVLSSINKHFEASEEAIPGLPTRQRKDSGTSESLFFNVEDKPEETDIMDVTKEEGTKTTPSGDKQSIESEPKSTPPVRQQNQGETDVQSDIADVSSTQKKPEGGDHVVIIEEVKATKTPTGDKAQYIEAEPKPTPPLNEAKTEVQSDKVDVLSTQEISEGVDTMCSIEETEAIKTPSNVKAQCIEAQLPPTRQQNEGTADVQSNKEEVSLTPKEKTEVGDSSYMIEEVKATKNTSNVEAQSVEFEPAPVPSVEQRTEGEPEVQLSKVSSTPEEKPEGGNTMRAIEEEETLKTPSPDKAQWIEGQPKPTPPVRRRNESKTEVQFYKVDITPTPPSRRRKSDLLSLNLESQTPEGEEVLPTPPSRRRREKLGSTRLSLDLESQPTPPARRRKDKEDDRRLSLNLETQPTPPTRRYKDRPESETVFHTAEFRKNNNQQTCEQKDSEEHTVKPTTPVRRKGGEVETDVTLVVCKTQEEKETFDKPTPPTRRKDSKAEKEILAAAAKLQEEKNLFKPDPPMRRKDSRADTEMVSVTPKNQLEDTLTQPTPPTRRKKDQTETDRVLLMTEDLQVIPTPRTRRKKDQTETDRLLLMTEDLQVIPTPPTRRKKDQTETDRVLLMTEDLQVIPTPPARRKKDHTEIDIASLKPEDLQVIPTPPTGHEECSEHEKVSVLSRLEVEENIKLETKQEDKEEHDRKPFISQEQLEDSVALVQEPTDVFSQTERISEMQPQHQDVDVSTQVSFTTNDTESLAEEMEEPLGPTMKEIFTEIKQMTEKGPKRVLVEGMPHESALTILDTSCADLEMRLKRLVFHLLDLRNHPAALNYKDMAKQLEEAEECRRCAQRQVSMLSKTNGDIGASTNVTVRDLEAMQQLSAQWNAALWDAASSVHSKEAQLQMVADFERQTQKVKATVERLKFEREALRMSPAESSFIEEERLLSFLRNMEQERTALGELIQTHAKLSPYLSTPEKQAAEIQQNNLQGQWRTLKKDAERDLYKVNAYAKENASLLQEVSALKDHLENIQKILDALEASPVSWDSRRAQEIMNINADLTSIQQQYLNLQQTSEDLGFQFRAETSIEQDLQNIKDQLNQMGERIAAATPTSSNPTLNKIVKVMTDALAWAKQTECDIKGWQKKVSLFPEEVHRQIKDLKKLQLEMSSKQTQLKALVEEVTELIPELHKADVPIVTLSLKALKDLSKSTVGKLAEAVREMESGLQTREKMSEQIADVDSWVVGHLRREALRREDYQSLSAADLDRRLRQIHDTLGEAEKHSAVTEALLMKSRDMSSELNISESSQLNEKLTNLQEEIKSIVSYEKSSCQKVMDIIQNQESSQRKVSSLENSLRQMLVDVKRHRFPVTKETLYSIEPFRQMVVERKSQIEQVHPCAEDKRKELLCVITELHHQMNDLDFKAQDHERYLSHRKCVEDLVKDVETQIPRTKNESIHKEERYRDCQVLLTQIALIKLLCEETRQELQEITADLYPTQLSAEETRLKQILENLKTRELAVNNNLHILEWDVLRHIHYLSEQKAFWKFLKDANKELEKSRILEPKEKVVEEELRKCVVLRKDIESRTRVLEFIEKRGLADEERLQNSKQLTCLRDMVLEKCDQRMVNLTKAKELLRNHTKTVINTIRFLQKAVLGLLPSVCSARSCSERLKNTQQALSTLDTEFQYHVSQIQTQAPQHPCFKPQEIEFLQTEVLGDLLVRLGTLKAQAQIQLENLKRCVECQKHSRKYYEELCQQVRDSETSLSQCASCKITSHQDCKDQQLKLRALVEEVDTLAGRLLGLSEWCSLHGCRANREDVASALWGQVARLQRCVSDLLTRSEQMEQEWSDVTHSVERAATVLEQVEAEFPDNSRENMTGDELQELLLCWSQYQDRLDCEHRALSALELRAARLLGVPSHLEKAPPIALCQELQALQEHYHSLKERSAQGQRAVKAEVEERERVQEELLGVREWLDAALSLLSVLEHEPSKKQLQEIHSQLCTQKAVLQRISEGLKMMYSERHTLVPEEIEGLVQEVSNSLQEVEEQVETAVEQSGPLHRLTAKISEVKAGLGSVQSWLEQKSLSFSEAESTQKRVWDELDGLHTRLATVEVELQDLSEMHPDETCLISENLANAQQTYTSLTKQAEQRTTFLSKIRDWLQEHEEMLMGSQSWISEAQSWLTTPCTYTTARCLDSHVNALQMVLDDSAQMRRTLQGFGSVLTEMGSVFDVSLLEEQLSNADRRVADMQHSLLGPLSQLEHAAAEVDAIEAEMKVMEKDVTKIKSTLTTQEGISRDKLKATESRIDLMKRTVAEIQNCKEGLCLPDKAENTLLVFKRAELLQKQVLELEQLALEYSSEVQEIFASLPDATPLNAPPLCVPPTITEEETQNIGCVSFVEQQESDEKEKLYQNLGNREEHDDDDEDNKEHEDQTENEQEEAKGSSAASLNAETSSSMIVEETESPEQTKSTDSKVEVDTEVDTSVCSGTGVSEASSEADVTEESTSLSEDKVTNSSSVTEISSSPPSGQQRCLVS